ncbi:LysR family transcriptional regulator [Paenibacillus methanolicus]|uniref:DNA-binding transcriptional LysR family regulator n=1 Tax=Paenibacillus methanolicus TaxID=582686 RepID=A0A5S5C592_9BACL|nr:LysR family transcriptional regulator [Paenibacillus methanolicus]TYP74487.1 DNA-binding transcriptional LysR family regulator [Paenibacillus methanolicus]
MDFKTLKSFQTIAKYGSFALAAEELNYAQSTVTMQIQKLESELGVLLLDRGKKCSLTDAGKLFLEQSSFIIERLEQLQTNMMDMHNGEVGTIRIGVTEPTASYRFPRLLKKFTSQYPKIRVALEISGTPVLLASLSKGDLDLAICSSPNVGSELFFQPLFHEKFVVLLPEDHPLAQYDVIRPEQLNGQTLLVTSENCPYRKKLEMTLRETGNIAVETMEIGSMTAMKPYVQEGFGIALVPELAFDWLPPGVTIRQMKETSIDMLMGLVYKGSSFKSNSASAKLLNFLKEELIDL